MLPIPWLIIGWLVSTGVAIGVGYLKGGEHARTAMLAAAAEASDRAIRRANTYALEDVEAARLAAERTGRQRLAARQIQHEFEMEALHGQLLTASPPICPADPRTALAQAPAAPRVNPGGMRLLNAAIDLYNANAAAPGGSGHPVPPDAPPRPERPGGGAGPAPTAGIYLRLSDYLRWHASGIGRMAAAAD